MSDGVIVYAVSARNTGRQSYLENRQHDVEKRSYKARASPAYGLAHGRRDLGQSMQAGTKHDRRMETARGLSEDDCAHIDCPTRAN